VAVDVQVHEQVQANRQDFHLQLDWDQVVQHCFQDLHQLNEEIEDGRDYVGCEVNVAHEDAVDPCGEHIEDKVVDDNMDGNIVDRVDGKVVVDHNHRRMDEVVEVQVEHFGLEIDYQEEVDIAEDILVLAESLMVVVVVKALKVEVHGDCCLDLVAKAFDCFVQPDEVALND
jgi:hypothetical protein